MKRDCNRFRVIVCEDDREERSAALSKKGAGKALPGFVKTTTDLPLFPGFIGENKNRTADYEF